MEDHLKYLDGMALIIKTLKILFLTKKKYIFEKKLKMNILGSIVSKRKIKENIGFVEVVNDINAVNDKTKPILIIGYNEAKTLYPNISILDKRIDNNIYWTFGKTEKKYEYDKDIKWFYEFVVTSAIENINYYYINILKLKYNNIKKIINILNNNEIKYIYINNNILYIYYNNYILGLSLEITDYLGIDRGKIINKIRKNKKNIIKYSDSFLDLSLKKVINNKKYVMPYFMSIQNVENEK